MVIFASSFSTWIAGLFNSQKFLPGLTLPFIVTIWLLLVICSEFFPSLLLPESSLVVETKPDLLSAFGPNIGQVMFQGGTVISGLFFSGCYFY
ncbi:urea transporter [Coprobacter sp.]